MQKMIQRIIATKFVDIVSINDTTVSKLFKRILVHWFELDEPIFFKDPFTERDLKNLFCVKVNKLYLYATDFTWLLKQFSQYLHENQY